MAGNRKKTNTKNRRKQMTEQAQKKQAQYTENVTKAAKKSKQLVKGALQQSAGGYRKAVSGTVSNAMSDKKNTTGTGGIAARKGNQGVSRRGSNNRNTINDKSLSQEKKQQNIKDINKVRESQKKGAERSSQLASKQIDRGTENIEKAKKDLGKGGKYAADLLVGGTQLAADIGIGMATGGSALPAVFARAYGGSLDSAEKEGASGKQAMMYGLASAGLETATEKLGNIAGPLQKAYGKGIADSFVDKVVGKMSKQGAKNVAYHGGKTLMAAVTEGLEEMIAEGLEPSIANAIYAEAIGKPHSTSAKEVLYAGAVGAGLGGILGGGGQIVEYNKGKKISDTATEVYGEGGVNDLINEGLDIDEDAGGSLRAETYREMVATGGIAMGQVAEMAQEVEAQRVRDNNRFLDADNAANREIKERNLDGIYEVDENGEVGLTAPAQAAFNENLKNNMETIENLQLPELDARQVAEQVAAIQTGIATVEDISQFTLRNPENRAIYEAITGVKLPATNQETKTFLFEAMVENRIKAAENQTAWRRDTVRGIVMQDIASGYGSAGQGAMGDTIEYADVDNIDSTETYLSGFDSAYNAGRAGMSYAEYSSIFEGANGNVPQEVMQAAHKAGEEDRVRASESAERVQLKLGQKVEKSRSEAKSAAQRGKLSVNLAPENKGRFGAQEQIFYKAIAKALNIEIRIVDNIQGNGMYVDGVVTLNINGDRNLGYIFFHEITHHLQDYAPQEYQKLKEFLRTAWVTQDSEGYRAALDAKKSQYAAHNVSLNDEAALDEIIADGTYEFLQDENFINELCAKERGVAQALLDAIKKLIDKIRAILVEGDRFTPKQNEALYSNLDILKEMERLWADALAKAVDNRDAVGTISEMESVAKNSFSSIASSFFNDPELSVSRFKQLSYKDTEGYKSYVEECLKNYEQTRPNMSREDAKAEIERQIAGIVRVAVASKQAGYDIPDYVVDSKGEKQNVLNLRDSKGRLLFSSLEPNSDYFTSNDISTICDKRKNFAEIYDEIVRREEEQNVPKGKRFFNNINNYFYIHKLLADMGLTQPCKQCYVESMRKNLAPMASAFIELISETDSNNKANAQLYHQKGKKKGELKENNFKLRERVLEQLVKDNMTAEDLTTEVLSTEDGLAQLRLKAPLIYEAFNSFYGQAKPKMPKAATPFRFGELTALLTDHNGKIKARTVQDIISTGGFRLQSYSDFQIENFVDVLQVIFEAGTLGLTGHAYTKVPAFLDVTEGTNLKRNISIFMYKDEDGWKIDRNDSFPYTLEKIYDIVNADESGNTGIIAVSQNEDMSAWIMANDNVGYGIPFHKSGLKMGVVRDTDVKTEDGRIVKGYKGIKDHTRQQIEVWAKTVQIGEKVYKKGTKAKSGIDIYEIWDFENKDGLSKNELIEKNLKAYIDECEKKDYLPKFREYLTSNERGLNNTKVLNNVLKYAKELGHVSEDATIEDISFEYKGYTIPYGYYKFLTDFGLFKPDGTASPQEVLSLKDYNFDKAVEYFENAEELRRNEILQQFSNGPEREYYQNSDYSTGQLADIIEEKRRAVADQVVARYSLQDSEGRELTHGQREFFKESKVRDEDGNLKVMYHGSENAGHHIFNSDFSYDNLSMFFTDSNTVAKGYSGTHEKYAARTFKTADDLRNFLAEIGEDGYEIREEDGKIILYDPEYNVVEAESDNAGEIYEGYAKAAGLDGSVNYEVYLNIKNPLVIDADFNYWDEIPIPEELEEGMQDFKEEDGNYATTRSFSGYAYENGYDGVIFNDIYDNGLYASSEEKVKSSTVAIVFDSNQIKSVDNLNPTEDKDIRYSLPDSDDVYDYINSNETEFVDVPPVRDYEKERARVKDQSVGELKKQVEKLQAQTKLTHGKVLDPKSIAEEVNMLIKTLLSYKDGTKKTDHKLIKTVQENAKTIYTDIKNGNIEDAAIRAWDVATDVIENLELINDEAYQEYKELRSYLKKTKIELPESFPYRKEFREENFGRLVLVNEGGRSIDDVYGDLMAAFPGTFDESIVTEEDMLQEIADVRASLEPYDIVLSEEETNQLIKETAHDILDIAVHGKPWKSWADRQQEIYNERTKKLKARHKEALRDVRTKAKDRADERVKAEREKAGERLKAAKDKAKDKADARVEAEREKTKAERQKGKQKANERVNAERWIANERVEAERMANARNQAEKRREQQESKERKNAESEKRRHIGRIEKDLKWLSDRLLKPTDDKHLPDGYQKAIAELLVMVDPQTARSKQLEEKYGISKKRMRFLELKAEYEKIAKSEAEGMIYNEDISIWCDELAKTLADADSIADATVEEMRVIRQLIRAITHSIREQNNAFDENLKAGIAELATETIHKAKSSRKTGQRGGLPGALGTLLNESMVTPRDFFEGIGGGLQKAFMSIRKGHDRHVDNITEARGFFAELFGQYANKKKPGSAIEEWRNHKTNETFELEGGTITMNIAQRMALYCSLKRDQAAGHIFGSGIVVAEASTMTKLKEALGAKKEINYGTTRITMEEAYKIIGTLSPEQIEIADKLQDFLNGRCAEWGNEASLKMFGYKKFTEQNYFPIKSADVYLDSNFEGRQTVERIRNFGFTKGTVVNANNPIVIDDIFTVVADHVNKMSMYNAFAAPIADFTRVYNFKTRDEAGLVLESTKDALANTYGKKVGRYITNFIADLQNNTQTRQEGFTRFVNKTLANYKKATIAANVRVAFQQPTALIRAFTVLDPKYFILKNHTPELLKKAKGEDTDYKDMLEHCPITRWKSWGFSQVDMARDLDDIMMNKEWSKLDLVTMQVYGVLDLYTWSKIWGAVRAETKAKHPDVEVDSDEFYAICNERASEIFDKTQVVDSVLHRSQVMRNTDTMSKILTSFMAEPTRTYNMVRSEYAQAVDMWTSGDKAKAGAKVARASSVYLFNALACAAAAAVADALRGKDLDGDDEEEEWWELTLSNFMGNANPLNLLPVFKEVSSIWKGWDTSNMALEGIEALVKAEKGLFDKMRGESDKPWSELIRKQAEALGLVFGVPVKNILREIESWGKIIGIDVFAAEAGEEEKAQDLKLITDGSSFDNFLNAVGINLSDKEKMDRDFGRTVKSLNKATKNMTETEKQEYLWKEITANYTNEIEAGNYAAIDNMRKLLKETGGDYQKFEESVISRTKTAMKKSIGTDSAMTEVYREQLKGFGMTDAVINQEVVMKSEAAKAFQLEACEDDLDGMTETIVTLYNAGLSEVELDVLYYNRSKAVDAKDYRTGELIAPCNGEITSNFGYRNAPTAGASSYHRGLDIAVPANSDIAAADGGKVSYAGYNSSYGYYVKILHGDGRYTLYAHLNGYYVQKGQSVNKGDVIALSGSTGVSTGPHLHFEVIENGVNVDPLPYLQ